MNENNVSEQKPFFTVKKILRVLSTVCIIFVFCPSFMVSCSGQKVDVSAMTAVRGVSAYGEQVVEPHPIMLFTLLIPVAVLVMLFMKGFITKEKKLALLTAICMGVDTIIWIIFRTTAKRIAEENYCSFKTTGWYVINIIVLLAMVGMSVLVFTNKMKMNADLLASFTDGNTLKALNQMSDTMTQMSKRVTQMAGNVVESTDSRVRKEDTIGFCIKCGGRISYGCKFCTSCGTLVPESVLTEAEEVRRIAREKQGVEEKVTESGEMERQEDRECCETTQNSDVEEKPIVDRLKFCHNCGIELEPGVKFCISCGTKVEE